jgi:hypothetical protein
MPRQMPRLPSILIGGGIASLLWASYVIITERARRRAMHRLVMRRLRRIEAIAHLQGA